MRLTRRTLSAALAALLIAAPAATARPVDTHASLAASAAAATTQDLRSPDARAAANRRRPVHLHYLQQHPISRAQRLREYRETIIALYGRHPGSPRPVNRHAHLARSAGAAIQDLRSPTVTQEVPPAPSLMAASARKQYEQLRSSGAPTQQDLRSPDARDAAEHRGTYNSPDVVIVKVPQPSPAAAGPSSTGGIDWADAGIGAATLLGLSLLALGGALVIARRRRSTHGAPPVTSP